MLETVFVGFMVFLLFAMALVLVVFPIVLVIEIVRTWFRRW